jgi:c-di-GMP-binding flagellar brake protein YcgR
MASVKVKRLDKDKRRFERHEAHLEVELGFPSGETQLTRTRDVSEGGVFILIDKLRRPIIGEVVTVKLLEGQESPIETFPSSDAVVVRQEEGGIGLAFIELDFQENF